MEPETPDTAQPTMISVADIAALGDPVGEISSGVIGRGLAEPTSTPGSATNRRDANQPPSYEPAVTPTPNARRPKPARRDNTPIPTPNTPAPQPTMRPENATARLKREAATRLAFARHEYPRIGRAMAGRICLHRQDFQTPLVGKRGKKRGG